MQAIHTVHTDDGSLRLQLGDGDTVADLIAYGSNRRQVVVHLSHRELHNLLSDASMIHLAFGRSQAEHCSTRTLGGVVALGQPAGSITLSMPARASAYTLTVDDAAGAQTSLTLALTAHESLMVGIGALVGQL
jgi:hypothetical protein